MQKDIAQLPKAAAQAVGKGHKGEQAHDDMVQRIEKFRKENARAHAEQDEAGKILPQKLIDLMELLHGRGSRFLW